MNFKEFWQRYKGEIGKLLITHAALAVFSIMCTSPLLVLDTTGNESSVNTIILIVTAFVFAFYYYLIRSQLWRLGAKNKISADGGRMKLVPLAGLYMGLIASIPSFLLNIVNIFAFCYKDYEFWRSIYGVSNLLEVLWDAPALGLILVTGSPVSYVAVSVLPTLFAGIAYYCGTKEFALFGIPRDR
ncbi:MAG: hypothetical protein IKW18_02575 [Clostridia bacterium]|nr:hypothetical protein [Clostridia bacterium]